MDFSCSVSSAGTSVDFYGDVDLYEYFSNLGYTRWVPEIVVSREPSLTGYRVDYMDELPMSFAFQDKVASATLPWEYTNEGQTLLYIGYPLMEVQRQASQSATIHASCVSLNGCGIIFLGGSGSGKTTLAMKLCREYSAELYANDLAVFGLDEEGLFCSGGTKFFNLRKESVKRSLPELLHLFPDSDIDGWQHKIIVDPKRLGVTSGTGVARIRSFYLVHVDDTKTELHVSDADNLTNRLTINENFVRYIRNATTVVMGGPNFSLLGDVPSMDRPEFYAWRKTAIEMMLQDLGTIYLSGPTDKIVDYIIKNCT